MPETPNTCANCIFWERLNDEMGRCGRYAPKPEIFKIDKTPERPLTPQWWIACGDWKKKV